MMLNGMKHICVGLLVALLSGTALAQSVPSGFSVVTDAVLVPSETVLGDDVEAQLGEYSVIKQSNVRAMSMSTQAQVTTDVRGEAIVLVQDALTGRYATTDGKILVRLENAESAESVALQFGLQIDKTFSNAAIVLMSSSSISTAVGLIDDLANSPEIRAANLNVNFYDIRPQ
jgi:hypothetical protein